MADQYIVIRGVGGREEGRWYNVSRMARICGYAEAAAGRSPTRKSPDAMAHYLPDTPVTFEATGVLEFAQYGGVAEVYRPTSS